MRSFDKFIYITKKTFKYLAQQKCCFVHWIQQKKKTFQKCVDFFPETLVKQKPHQLWSPPELGPAVPCLLPAGESRWAPGPSPAHVGVGSAAVRVELRCELL